VIVCLATVINCYTSSTQGVWYNAGRASSRVLVWSLSVKQEKKKDTMYTLAHVHECEWV